MLAAVLLSPSSAWADGHTYLRPSIVLETVHDSNLFFQPAGRVSDTIFRATPRLEAGYRSPTFEIGWRYIFDAERYLDHTELSTAVARQTAGTTLLLVATERVRFGTDASYFRTQTPQDLNVTTALVSERATAERWTLSPAITYQMSSRNQGTVSYAYTRDYASYPIAGTVLTQTDNARFAFTRRVTAADGVVLEYQARRFTFDGRSDLRHVVMTGWERRISSRTDLTLHVGPRLAGGSVAPEAALSVRQRRTRGDISVQYARSESASIGQERNVDYQRLAFSITARPGRGFELGVLQGVVKNTSPAAGLNATVYAIDVDLTKSIGAWVVLSGAFRRTVQHGTVAFVDRTIPHSVVMLRLVVSRQR